MSNLVLLLKTDLIRTFKLNKLKKSNRFKSILTALLIVFIAVYIFFAMGSYTYLGIKYFQQYGLEKYVLPIVYFLCGFTIFYTTIYRAKSYLFNADDTLFAMPIKPSTILTSRVITLICLSYFVSTIIFVPAAITYGYMLKLGVSYYIFAFLGFLFMPFVPNILGSIFGYFIGYVTSKMGNKRIFETILTYIAVLLVMFVSFNVPNIASKFINNVDVINNVLNNVGFLIKSFMKMVTEYSLSDLLIYFVTNIVSVVIFVILFQSSYTKILQSLKVERTKAKFIEKEHKNKGIVSTLLTREFRTYMSIPIYILNTSFGIIIVLFASIAALFYDKDIIFKMANVSNGSLSTYAMILLMVAFCTTMSNTAACSISIEGKNFWILKSMPIKTNDIFLSKILLNILVVFPLTAVAIVLFSISFKLTIIQIITTTLLALGINISCSLFGLILNLKFPRLDFISYTQVVKQSLSSFLGIMVPLFVFVGLVVIYTKLNIAIDTYILLLFTLLLLAIMVQYNILKKWGIKRFNEIN